MNSRFLSKHTNPTKRLFMKKYTILLITLALNVTTPIPCLASTKDWSILICTLEKRKQSFEFIYNKLQQQIHQNGLDDKVELLYFSDMGENTVGFKRNALLQQSKGCYVNFMDDDDDVADNYISMIHEKLKLNPDCVNLIGIITTNGKNPKKFIHSINYHSWFEKDGIYYRPPNHLNPIKRSIAIQFLFPEKNYGEDAVWSMAIAKSGLLQKEEWIDTPYYFYLFVTKNKRKAFHEIDDYYNYGADNIFDEDAR